MLHLDVWITKSLYAFFEKFKRQVRFVRRKTFTYAFDEDGVVRRNAEAFKETSNFNTSMTPKQQLRLLLSTSNSAIQFRLRIRNLTTDFDQVRNKENQSKPKYQMVHNYIITNGNVANRKSRCLQFQAVVLRFSNQTSESRCRGDCRLPIEDLGQSYRDLEEPDIHQKQKTRTTQSLPFICLTITHQIFSIANSINWPLQQKSF